MLSIIGLTFLHVYYQVFVYLLTQPICSFPPDHPQIILMPLVQFVLRYLTAKRQPQVLNENNTFKWTLPVKFY